MSLPHLISMRHLDELALASPHRPTIGEIMVLLACSEPVARGAEVRGLVVGGEQRWAITSPPPCLSAPLPTVDEIAQIIAAAALAVLVQAAGLGDSDGSGMVALRQALAPDLAQPDLEELAQTIATGAAAAIAARLAGVM